MRQEERNDVWRRAAPMRRLTRYVLLRRRVLFQRNPGQSGHPPYEVAPDGKHFLMVRSAADDADLVIVLNWVDEWRNRRTTPNREISPFRQRPHCG